MNRPSPLGCLIVLLSAVVDAPCQEPAGRDLRHANFRGANLVGANLAGTDLRRADFGTTDLTGVSLWRARLDEADLRETRGLTAQQLCAAMWDEDEPPRLPRELDTFRRFWEKRSASGISLQGANLWGANLRRFDFTGSDLRGAVFLDADLRGASLQRADVTGAMFAGADVSGVDFRGTTGLDASQLVGMRWDPDEAPVLGDELNLVRARFEKRSMVEMALPGAVLWLADLHGANLVSVDLTGAALIGANLRDATLRDANLTGAALAGADISGADLRGAILTARQLVSARWDRQHAPRLDDELNLTRELFQARRLQGIDLGGANLWGVDLSKANLEGASLRGATLVDVRLRGANLIDADLLGANLTRADLSGAILSTAKGLSIGQLLSARWDDESPPTLDGELLLYRNLWEEGDLRGRHVGPSCLWDARLEKGRFQSARFQGVSFVRSRLRDASFARGSLRDVEFLGADISGVDFRGTSHVTNAMILAAVWDPRHPPVLDTELNALREFIQERRFPFDLAGANLQGPDPTGVMGPVRDDDEVASWRRAHPPRLGMDRLVKLLRARKFGRLWLRP